MDAKMAVGNFAINTGKILFNGQVIDTKAIVDECVINPLYPQAGNLDF